MSNTYKPPQEQIDALGNLPVDEVLEMFRNRENEEQYKLAYFHFSDVMSKAIKGCICTPERMAFLYPLFREIAEEKRESELLEEKDRLQERLREVKKQLNPKPQKVKS
jgi:hypothetical protein